ncbi:MAG: hypothetical protein U0Y10_01340 [Spirosomataceae bacterium]
MKKQIFLSIASLFIAGAVLAQSAKPYKVRFSGEGKRVNIYVYQNAVTVEGYDGDEVIIEQVGERKELPREAEGLRMITGGVVDNSGTGANIEQEGNNLQVVIPRSRYNGNFVIKVPRNLSVSLKEDGTWSNNQKFSMSNLSGEVELKVNSGSPVYLSDISGPLVANGNYGKFYITYSQLSPKAPHSITTNGAVDITLPTDAKANLKLRSYGGDIFTDFDIAPVKKDKEMGTRSDAERAAADRARAGSTNISTVAPAAIATSPKSSGSGISYSGQTVTVNAYALMDDCDQCPPAAGRDGFEGTINGGGVSLQVKSSNGNIYVRKKK